ncbi:tyrosine-type recombinase/integrase [Halobellus rarus]|uniref:Tyrosine-type recombinase/integrase n=1 Tax=Halobellus rarus TaxID=1126237 RepID=A0ABD6CKB5_9EURY|nr:tyrosine-type recombinase/integrase [Halobellus rarus]
MSYPQVVDDWLSDREMMYDSEKSYKKRESDVRQFVGWLQDNDKSFDPIDRERHKQLLHRYFLSLKSDGYARNTILGRWDTLRMLYDDLAGFQDEIEETPFEELYKKSNYLPDKTRDETKSEKPYVTLEDKNLLCENVTPPAFRNELMIRLMWQTGLREGEVANLRVEDVNLEENKLDKFWSPKIQTERTVTFKESLNWWLSEWLQGGYRDSYPTAKESEYLFLTNRSEKMPDDRPNKIIKKAADNAGIQGVLKIDKAGKTRHKITSHAIRRGHAMHLLKNDVDLRTIQKRLGHAKLETTMEYLPISPEDTSDKIEGIQF